MLNGTTRGYTRHPQLSRFRTSVDPLAYIGRYLQDVAAEADDRRYRFDRARIVRVDQDVKPLPVPDGQLAWEWSHLMAKLSARSPEVRERWTDVVMPEPHPLFEIVQGPIADWERAAPPQA